MNKFLKAAILLVAASFVLLLGVLFVTGEGGFSLTALFDKLLNGAEEEGGATLPSEVLVMMSAENDCYAFDMDTDMEGLLFDYFRLWYGGLGELIPAEKSGLSQVYSYTSADELYDKAVYSHHLTLRAESEIALTYPYAEVKISYLDTRYSAAYPGVIEVTLTESFSTTYDGLGGRVSSELMRGHFFKLARVDGAWRIEEHVDQSVFGAYAREIWEELLEERGLRADTVTRAYVGDYLDEFLGELRAGEADFTDEAPDMPEYPYDRAAALAYATEWTSHDRILRNGDYASQPRNDVSFTSQCLVAGGIPMDVHGEIWKWFGSALNETTAKEGYSSSFVEAEAFLDYVQKNVGFGLVAYSVRAASLDEGDIVRLGDVVCQLLVTGRSGGELVLSGNSPDCVDVPVSTLGFSVVHGIKILGYNSTSLRD